MCSYLPCIEAALRLATTAALDLSFLLSQLAIQQAFLLACIRDCCCVLDNSRTTFYYLSFAYTLGVFRINQFMASCKFKGNNKIGWYRVLQKIEIVLEKAYIQHGFLSLVWHSFCNRESEHNIDSLGITANWNKKQTVIQDYFKIYFSCRTFLYLLDLCWHYHTVVVDFIVARSAGHECPSRSGARFFLDRDRLQGFVIAGADRVVSRVVPRVTRQPESPQHGSSDDLDSRYISHRRSLYQNRWTRHQKACLSIKIWLLFRCVAKKSYFRCRCGRWVAFLTEFPTFFICSVLVYHILSFKIDSYSV